MRAMGKSRVLFGALRVPFMMGPRRWGAMVGSWQGRRERAYQQIRARLRTPPGADQRGPGAQRFIVKGALGALVVVSAASAGGSSTPGVTAKQILIGGTAPLSGPASAYASVAKGADAYFKYVNDHGGVFGRSIKYKYDDDAYDPSQTIEKTRDLVQNDKVFAIYNTLGTE